MECIALAFSNNQVSHSTLADDICSIAKSFGYDPILHGVEVYGDGLKSFTEEQKIGLVVYLNKSTHRKIKFSSLEITNEMTNSFLDEKVSNFEKFVHVVSKINYQGDMYILFAEEWYEDRYIKYYQGSVDKLFNILKINLGWRTLLYNFKNKAYSYDNETPLVFRVQRQSEKG